MCLGLYVVLPDWKRATDPRVQPSHQQRAPEQPRPAAAEGESGVRASNGRFYSLPASPSALGGVLRYHRPASPGLHAGVLHQSGEFGVSGDQVETTFNDFQFSSALNKSRDQVNFCHFKNHGLTSELADRSRSRVELGWTYSTQHDPFHRFLARAMVLAQLVERSLPTPVIRGSKPDIGKILCTNCTIEKI